MRLPPKADLLSLVVPSIVAVLLWLPRAAGPLDLRWDGAVYYVLGTSLAEGKGYRLLNEPGDIEACQYPPLLPLMAAIPQVILGTSDPLVVGRWLKLLFFCCHWALAFVTYLLLKRFVPRWLAFVGALVLLLNAQATFHSNFFFTEIPFALVTGLFVLCSSPSPTRVREALAGALGVMAFLLRTAAVALLIAWVAEALLRKQVKRAAGRLVVSAIPVLCWNAYVLHVEHSASYANPAYPYQRAPYLNYNVSYVTNLALENDRSPAFRRATLRELTERFLHNALGIGVSLGEAVSGNRDYWKYRFGSRAGDARFVRRWGFYAPPILVGGLVLGGIVALFGRGSFLIPIYVLVSMALICATPSPEQFLRYLTALLPFLLVALFVCVLATGEWIRRFSRGSGLLFVSTGLAVVLALVFDAERGGLGGMYRGHFDEVTATARDGRRLEYRAFYYGGKDESLDRGLAWLRAAAKPRDVIAVSVPQWAYLVTGLKAVRPPLEFSHARTQELLDSVPVAYVVLDFTNIGGFTVPYLAPVLDGEPRVWKLVYRDREGAVAIYERVRPGDDAR